MLNQIHLGDCLEVMKQIPDGSVDMILCDLPYGTTANKWDSVIPLEPLWEQYRRVIKPNGAIVLTGQGRFTVDLIVASGRLYRYSLVWEKTKAGGFLNARRMPMQAHEDIAVFYKGLPTYHPQMEPGEPYRRAARTDGDGGNYGRFSRAGTVNENPGERFPRSVLRIANDNHGSIHPTHKPVALFEYLIRTYTNPGDVVLDNCIGSGTTAIAAVNTGRRFIGVEKDPEYHRIATERLRQHTLPDWLLPVKELSNA